MPSEQWRPVVESALYEVSDQGRVRRANTCRSLMTVMRRGYPRVTILTESGERLSRSVHRLVAEAFIPNPKNLPVVHHRNGHKEDARASNLEWVTQRTNVNAYHGERRLTIHEFARELQKLHKRFDEITEKLCQLLLNN